MMHDLPLKSIPCCVTRCAGLPCQATAASAGMCAKASLAAGARQHFGHHGGIAYPCYMHSSKIALARPPNVHNPTPRVLDQGLTHADT